MLATLPAPLSIIIPTYNSANYLKPTITSLYPGLWEQLICELIICDASEESKTQAIADKVGGIYLRTPRGRGTQLDFGAKHSRGSWLLFLHSDTRLGENWISEVVTHIQLHPDKAGYFQLKYSSLGIFPKLTAGFANLRSSWFDLPYGDQGLLISREQYLHVGGFPDIPLMEDVHIARKLKGSLRGLNCEALTNADRKEQMGWIRSGIINLTLITRYFLGVHPSKLYEEYYESS